MDSNNLISIDISKLTKDQTEGLRCAMDSGFEPKVAIIVLHYGNPNDTLECLRSIVELQYENAFAVILDNGTETKYSILAYKNMINNLTQAKNWKFEDLSAHLTGLPI
ncbi:MAG: glycosyltransferase family 2 protein [bacterium]